MQLTEVKKLNVRIIKVNKVDLILSKDIIEVKSLDDLIDISLKIGGLIIYQTENEYYIIGSDICFIYKKRK